MTASRHALCVAGAALLILAAATPGAAEPQPRRVLLLHSFDEQFAPFDYFTASFRMEVGRLATEPIEFYEISLQPARFSESPPEAPIVDYILAMFARQRPDLLVPIGGPAAMFAKQNRARLFPDTPMLIASVDVVHMQGIPLAENEAVVSVVHDAGAVIDGFLELLPDTKTVFLVLGNSSLERFWRQRFAERLRAFEERLSFIWSDSLSFPETLRRSATLPPDSVILYLAFSVDTRNVPITEARGLPALHAAANAPIFGMHSSQLGHGVVGGNLMSMDLLSQNAATAALRMLKGEPARAIRIEPLRHGPQVFDWRELRRWSIDEARLPPGSIVQFREPSVWDRYRVYVVAGSALWLLVTSLVLALLFNLVRRRRAERSVRESANRLQGILDTAIEGIVTVDEHGVIESVNAAAEGMFGYRASEAVGQHVNALISGSTGRRKDGASFPIEIGMSDVVLPGRRIRSHFVRDVTERRRIEELDRELSRRLLEAQEVERARVARELHDDVTQRLARLSIEAGRYDSLPERSRQAVRDELARISEDVHALAYRLHPALLDRLGLARGLNVECERFSRQHSIRVGVTVERLPEKIPHDAALGLFRVAQEALANVGRHARASGAQVVLRPAEQGLELIVTDTGVGFAAAAEQDRPSLGLASMRERMRLLGGEFSVESQPGRGTTLRAWVPLQREAPATVSARDVAKCPRVLLADDNDGITDALRQVLAPEFEVVDTVRNGVLLLEAVARLDPDVIVADISMPLLDGLGALAQLKRRNPGVKVVLITTYREPALARAALADGACGFVLKNLAPSELPQAIRAALAGRTYVSPALAARIPV